jgi:hypothetical protein
MMTAHCSFWSSCSLADERKQGIADACVACKSQQSLNDIESDKLAAEAEKSRKLKGQIERLIVGLKAEGKSTEDAEKRWKQADEQRSVVIKQIDQLSAQRPAYECKMECEKLLSAV